jgi:hypothetical protein
VKTLLGFIIFKIKTHKTKKYFIKIKQNQRTNL